MALRKVNNLRCRSFAVLEDAFVNTAFLELIWLLPAPPIASLLGPSQQS